MKTLLNNNHDAEQADHTQADESASVASTKSRRLVVIAASLIALGIIVVLWFAFRQSKPTTSTQPSHAEKGQSSGAMAGMKMEGSSTAPAAEEVPKSIFVAPERQQLIGVKTAPAARRSLVKEIRAVGKVAYDETKVTHIHTKVNGYVEEVFADFVGEPVTKGKPLFTIYSPDLLATQEEFLLALKSRKTLSDSQFQWVSQGSDDLLEASRRRLKLWDVTDKEIEALEKDGKVKRAVTIVSPVSGIVTERAAYHHGKYVTPEMDLYTIVDLSTVWIVAEVYEYEQAYIREGQTAEVEFPYEGSSKPLRGKVSFVYPFVDPKTRTVKVRMEFPNPNMTLRPDTFFNVKLKTNLAAQITVPEDAVLDTGAQQYVFVDLGDGYFEPRPVKIAAMADGYATIEKGLKADERVVTAANFILDSESRLKGVFANMGKPSEPGAATGTAAARLKVEFMEPKEAKVGNNAVRLMVKDTAGQPVENAEVNLKVLMPQMGSMPPMSTSSALQPQGGGIYVGTVEIPMAWTWEATVTVKKDGKTLGVAQSNITAR